MTSMGAVIGCIPPTRKPSSFWNVDLLNRAPSDEGANVTKNTTSFYSYLTFNMAAHNWEAQAQICRDILDNSIPKQWLLPADQLPSPERTNVLDIPRECGILTERELQITETDATGLVETMAKGIWTAEEVTIAFLKRATIGHQLVGLPGRSQFSSGKILIVLA
jgi:hypothetical protein